MSTKTLHDAVVLWDHEGAMGIEGEPIDLASLRGKRVVVVLARRMTQLRTAELPPAAAGDLRQLVTMRLGDLFPVPASEIAFSVAPRGVADGEMAGVVPGPTAIYAARHTDLAAIHASARTNGFTIAATLPAAAGSAELAQELGLSEALILERDGDGIGLDVIHDLELALSRRTTLRADLEGEVRRTFIASKTGALPIVATNGFHVPFADRHSPRTATAVLVENSDRWPALDLIPEEIRVRRASDLRRQSLRQGALVALAGVMVAGYVASERSSKGAEAARLTATANSRVRRAEATLASSTSRIAKLDPQAKILERAFRPAQRAGDILYLVPSLLPPGAWLANFTFDRGRPLLLRGSAKDSGAVAVLLKNLSNQGRFRDVRLSAANTGEVEGQAIVNFSLTLFPIGNVPLEEAKRTR